MKKTKALLPFPPRKKTQGEWLMETLVFYAERGIALPPVQVMLWQRARSARQ